MFRHLNQGAKPRATTRRLVDPTVRQRIEQCFINYGPLNTVVLDTIYYHDFGEVLDAIKLGFPQGKSQLFANIESLEKTGQPNMWRIKAEYAENVSPKQDQVTISDGKQASPLSHYLKRCPPQFKYSQEFVEQIYIIKSPFQMRDLENRQLLSLYVGAIRRLFDSYPGGVPVIALTSYVDIKKTFFKVTSINELVGEYPEIFYLGGSDSKSDATVFDARTYTYSFEGQVMGYYDALIMLRCIDYGFYFQTLALIHKAITTGGLKLGVWFETIKQNFKFDSAQETKLEVIFQKGPLYLANLFKTQSMVTIFRPEKLVNDIRLMPPSHKIDPLVVRSNAVRLIKEIQEKPFMTKSETTDGSIDGSL